MQRVWLGLYGLLWHLFLPLAWLKHFKATSGTEFKSALRQRLGSKQAFSQADVWLHCASAGEAQALRVLVRMIQSRFPKVRLLLTTQTGAGLKALGDLKQPTVQLALMPFDLGWCMRRILQYIRPQALLIVEKEIWPNLLNACRHTHIPYLLLSFSVSERSQKRYKRWKHLFLPLLESAFCIATQTEQDCQRLAALALPAHLIHWAGNLKWCRAITHNQTLAQTDALYHPSYQPSSHAPLITVGNTHEPEEAWWLDAYQLLLHHFSELRIVLAPRHVERAAPLAAMVQKKGFSVSLSSDKGTAESTPVIGQEISQVIILNQIGTLMEAYRQAELCFVGGSLYPQGQGHNLYEPCQLGKPCLFGPHLGSWREAAEEILAAEAGVMLQDHHTISDQVKQLLRNPQQRQNMGDHGLALSRRKAQHTAERYQAIVAKLEPLLGSPR